MVPNRRLSPALQALTELETDSPAPIGPTPSAGATPALREVLAKLGRLPPGALFLGIASDRLPVLLDLHDPVPGPVLVAGDAGSGKTILLRTVAHSAALTHAPQDVQLGVITTYPDEWEDVRALPHCLGIFPVGQAGAPAFLHSLAERARAHRNIRQSILLLVDGLESIVSLEPASVQSFRWLLLRGSSRRVWPMVTLGAARCEQARAWLPGFRTRFFGRVSSQTMAEALGGDAASAFDQLEAGVEFCLREKETWLRFWLPSC